jgi:hypothetical protein
MERTKKKKKNRPLPPGRKIMGEGILCPNENTCNLKFPPLMSGHHGLHEGEYQGTLENLYISPFWPKHTLTLEARGELSLKYKITLNRSVGKFRDFQDGIIPNIPMEMPKTYFEREIPPGIIYKNNRFILVVPEHFMFVASRFLMTTFGFSPEDFDLWDEFDDGGFFVIRNPLPVTLFIIGNPRYKAENVFTHWKNSVQLYNEQKMPIVEAEEEEEGVEPNFVTADEGTLGGANEDEVVNVSQPGPLPPFPPGSRPQPPSSLPPLVTPPSSPPPSSSTPVRPGRQPFFNDPSRSSPSPPLAPIPPPLHPHLPPLNPDVIVESAPNNETREESAMDVDQTPPTPEPPVQIDLEESEGRDMEERGREEEEERPKEGRDILREDVERRRQEKREKDKKLRREERLRKTSSKRQRQEEERRNLNPGDAEDVESDEEGEQMNVETPPVVIENNQNGESEAIDNGEETPSGGGQEQIQDQEQGGGEEDEVADNDPTPPDPPAPAPELEENEEQIAEADLEESGGQEMEEVVAEEGEGKEDEVADIDPTPPAPQAPAPEVEENEEQMADAELEESGGREMEDVVGGEEEEIADNGPTPPAPPAPAPEVEENEDQIADADVEESDGEDMEEGRDILREDVERRRQEKREKDRKLRREERLRRLQKKRERERELSRRRKEEEKRNLNPGDAEDVEGSNVETPPDVIENNQNGESAAIDNGEETPSGGGQEQIQDREQGEGEEDEVADNAPTPPAPPAPAPEVEENEEQIADADNDPGFPTPPAPSPEPEKNENAEEKALREAAERKAIEEEALRVKLKKLEPILKEGVAERNPKRNREENEEARENEDFSAAKRQREEDEEKSQRAMFISGSSEGEQMSEGEEERIGFHDGREMNAEGDDDMEGPPGEPGENPFGDDDMEGSPGDPGENPFGDDDDNMEGPPGSEGENPFDPPRGGGDGISGYVERKTRTKRAVSTDELFYYLEFYSGEENQEFVWIKNDWPGERINVNPPLRTPGGSVFLLDDDSAPQLRKLEKKWCLPENTLSIGIEAQPGGQGGKYQLNFQCLKNLTRNDPRRGGFEIRINSHFYDFGVNPILGNPLELTLYPGELPPHQLVGSAFSCSYHLPPFQFSEQFKQIGGFIGCTSAQTENMMIFPTSNSAFSEQQVYVIAYTTPEGVFESSPIKFAPGVNNIGLKFLNTLGEPITFPDIKNIKAIFNIVWDGS